MEEWKINILLNLSVMEMCEETELRNTPPGPFRATPLMEGGWKWPTL